MAITPDKLYNAYLQHYNIQAGGRYPVFRGTPFQRGDGLGDILRGAMRFLAPIASSIAKTFIKDTATGLSRGSNLKDSAKSAIAPTFRAGVNRAIERAVTGQGRRRRRRRVGLQKVGQTRRAIRKKGGAPAFGGRKRKHKHYKRSRKAKRAKTATLENF